MEREVRERHALQLVHEVADRFDHAVNLAMLALVDRDAEPRVLRIRRQNLDLCGQRDRAVVELNAFAEPLDVLGAQLAVDLHVIRLRHVARGREELRRQLTVVGEQQNTLGIEIETADRLHRHRQVLQVVHDHGTTTVIRHCRDAALGLVEHDVEVLERDYRLAIDRDVVLVRIDLGAEHRDRLAVDVHASRGDQIFGLAARRHTR